MVIITIGESPDLSYLPEGPEKFRDWLVPKADLSIMDGVFAVGDVIRPGLLAHAIARPPSRPGGRRLVARREVRGRAQGASAAQRLHTAYFAKYHSRELPRPLDDHARCVSCGTCRDCKMCLKSCPEKAIDRNALSGGFEYVSDPARCIGCGICAGVCPCGIWSMRPNCDLSWSRCGSRLFTTGPEPKLRACSVPRLWFPALTGFGADRTFRLVHISRRSHDA